MRDFLLLPLSSGVWVLALFCRDGSEMDGSCITYWFCFSVLCCCFGFFSPFLHFTALVLQTSKGKVNVYYAILFYIQLFLSQPRVIFVLLSLTLLLKRNRQVNLLQYFNLLQSSLQPLKSFLQLQNMFLYFDF